MRLLLLPHILSLSLPLLILASPAAGLDVDPKGGADPIGRLAEQLQKNERTLNFDRQWGYLPAVLDALNVPPSSQSLVFSKTSLQRDQISPAHPRALYFNDDVYVGWVDGGRDLEIAVADPKEGASFYTLPQEKSDRPAFVRQTDSCLQCHGGSMTRETPGFLLRSVIPDPEGQPVLSAGTSVVDHETPFKDRWGGWYVTGKTGAQPHLGNVTSPHRDSAELPPGGMNLTDLSAKFDGARYLSGGTSDVVALLVFEHQAEMHNRLARASLLTRNALRDEHVLDEALDRPAKAEHSESTRRRIKSACEPLVEYLLFANEAKLPDGVEGSTKFAADFAAAGPRDSHGRSLRDFDLKTRVFKYPCSYLIYSESFDALPTEARDYVYGRVLEVLIGEDISRTFKHLTKEDRLTILDILRETKRGLPDKWKTAAW